MAIGWLYYSLKMLSLYPSPVEICVCVCVAEGAAEGATEGGG